MAPAVCRAYGRAMLSQFTGYRFLRASAVAGVALLWACGGGGSDGDAPSGEAPSQPDTTRPTSTVANSTIAGRITFSGAAPTARPISMASEATCAAVHEDDPQLAEAWVIGADGGVANAIVQIKGTIPSHDSPVPAEPVVMDQKGCVYAPHAEVLRVGQTLKVLNPDGVTHNVNAQPRLNTAFNAGMPSFRTELEHVFDTAEDVAFAIRCDVHPWMGAWAVVLDHPFFAVTDDSGRFSIGNLPAGTYELEIWHESGGTQTQTITVAEGATAQADFVLAAS